MTWHTRHPIVTPARAFETDRWPYYEIRPVPPSRRARQWIRVAALIVWTGVAVLVGRIWS